MDFNGGLMAFDSDPKIQVLKPAIALSFTGLEAGVDMYAELNGGAPPSTLLVPLGLVWEAYKLLPDLPHKLLIVPVPGMPTCCWALCGGAGMVISPF